MGTGSDLAQGGEGRRKTDRSWKPGLRQSQHGEANRQAVTGDQRLWQALDPLTEHFHHALKGRTLLLISEDLREDVLGPQLSGWAASVEEARVETEVGGVPAFHLFEIRMAWKRRPAACSPLACGKSGEKRRDAASTHIESNPARGKQGGPSAPIF